MKIERFDHLVLTVRNIEATCRFYSTVLGMQIVDFNGRKGLKFGQHKFNLQELGHEIDPKADRPTPGSADFCLITPDRIELVVEHLSKASIRIVEGPVERSGALGPIRSVYFRDPDLNLIEVSTYAV